MKCNESKNCESCKKFVGCEIVIAKLEMDRETTFEENFKLKKLTDSFGVKLDKLVAKSGKTKIKRIGHLDETQQQEILNLLGI